MGFRDLIVFQVCRITDLERVVYNCLTKTAATRVGVVGVQNVAFLVHWLIKDQLRRRQQVEQRSR